jgi:hypothetical protein
MKILTQRVRNIQIQKDECVKEKWKEPIFNENLRIIIKLSQ